MGNGSSNELDQTWAWVGILGIIALIIALILLFTMDNKAVGVIVLILAIITIFLAAYLWWASQNKTGPINNF